MNDDTAVLPEIETDRKLHLVDMYESALDTLFDRISDRMRREQVTFPAARAALRMMVGDEIADAFEEWWGEDDSDDADAAAGA